jgi:hypothetical protein
MRPDLPLGVNENLKDVLCGINKGYPKAPKSIIQVTETNKINTGDMQVPFHACYFLGVVQGGFSYSPDIHIESGTLPDDFPALNEVL